MGYWRYLALAGIVAIAVVGLLVYTGVQPPKAKDEYPEKALGILAFKNIALDPGFRNTMIELLDSMGCGINPSTGTDTCKLPFRFQHLKALAQRDAPLIKDYQVQLCKIEASVNYQSDHMRLCSALQKIYRELDSIQFSTDQVGKLLSNNTPEALDPILTELALRLERSHQIFIKIVAELRTIRWLESALPDPPQSF